MVSLSPPTEGEADMMELDVNTLDQNKKSKIPAFDEKLGFGRHFSDHMFVMEYANGKWEKARIEAFQNFSMSPASSVFHYGQSFFDGMKTYRRDDSLYLFRPEMNLNRLNDSAKQLEMPAIDTDFVMQALKKLILIDKDWIPQKKGYSLYIRPTMIANTCSLGVHPADRYIFYIITGPAGAYYPQGFKPIKIFVSDQYVRAVKGGVGSAKASGNYAASMRGMAEGEKHGCQQVLWLDAIERKYLEEVGAMNIFVRFKDELATPRLNGAILPGITRDSILTITKSWGLTVNERDISIDEVIDGIHSGKVLEVFGTGTAAIISPVASLLYKGTDHVIPEHKEEKLCAKLFDYLTALQVGEEEDHFGFVSKFKVLQP